MAYTVLMFAVLTTFAQDYMYSAYGSGNTPGQVEVPGAYVGVLFLIIAFSLLFSVVMLWRIFVKAGQPGWAALVPVYNVLILLQIIGRPWWWVFFTLAAVVPVAGWIVSFVATAIMARDLAKSFGQGIDVAILLVILPVFGYPLLAFGSHAQYQ